LGLRMADGGLTRGKDLGQVVALWGQFPSRGKMSPLTIGSKRLAASRRLYEGVEAWRNTTKTVDSR